jgi:integrin beta 3
MTAEQFAEVIHGLIARALAPMAARLGVLEDGRGELGGVRERLAVLETKGAIPGPAGADGAPGADGLGFEDLTVDHDGERGFVFKLARGERVREVARVSIPVMLYRGVYAPGAAYEPGDVVTHGGSAWHCHKATATRPETAEGAACWRLIVKRGDKGKSAPGV